MLVLYMCLYRRNAQMRCRSCTLTKPSTMRFSTSWNSEFNPGSVLFQDAIKCLFVFVEHIVTIFQSLLCLFAFSFFLIPSMLDKPLIGCSYALAVVPIPKQPFLFVNLMYSQRYQNTDNVLRCSLHSDKSSVQYRENLFFLQSTASTFCSTLIAHLLIQFEHLLFLRAVPPICYPTSVVRLLIWSAFS